jgi:hypothetical protein
MLSISPINAALLFLEYASAKLLGSLASPTPAACGDDAYMGAGRHRIGWGLLLAVGFTRRIREMAAAYVRAHAPQLSFCC